MVVFTIGHSTRGLDELVGLLRAHGAAGVADVRTFPASRRLPQFGGAALAASLPAHGLRYTHLPQLGGRRRPRPGSPNTGWRNPAFRGYADHMATAEWQAGLERLLELAAEVPTAAMCAEALPWRCHRTLIADALVVRGVEVRHILGAGPDRPHRMTAFARVEGDRITYPGPDTLG